MNLVHRPRRNRKNSSIRKLVQETCLHPSDFVLPLFLVEGQGKKEKIASMPGVHRHSVDSALELIQSACHSGLKSFALFPSVPENKKDPLAKESYNPDSLVSIALQEIKNKFPEVILISDVAMDPYSSDGHDGIVKDGKILNDESLEVLAKMAVAQARAGADIVAPSDMMDGRVAFIRKALDDNSFTETGILSYTAKYCSSFYGPFREALDSAPKAGDKKTYQMDPANSREALRELELDMSEGADMVMVKPAHSYLDIIHQIKQNSHLPVAAYHVSGEYAMIAAAAEKGFLDFDLAMTEVIQSIKRAGADFILSYYALEAARKG